MRQYTNLHVHTRTYRLQVNCGSLVRAHACTDKLVMSGTVYKR